MKAREYVEVHGWQGLIDGTVLGGARTRQGYYIEWTPHQWKVVADYIRNDFLPAAQIGAIPDELEVENHENEIVHVQVLVDCDLSPDQGNSERRS